MVLSQPWFWSQNQMSYGKMRTRVGSIDFDIKLKIHLKKLMPGFVPIHGAILLMPSHIPPFQLHSLQKKVQDMWMLPTSAFNNPIVFEKKDTYDKFRIFN